LGAACTQAVLTADLASDEREAWAAQLDTWADELASYTREPPFRAAAAAADRGWDDDRLQNVLDETGESPRLWENDRPWYADDVAVSYLDVLERNGRTDAYLRLAKAAGQVEQDVGDVPPELVGVALDVREERVEVHQIGCIQLAEIGNVVALKRVNEEECVLVAELDPIAILDESGDDLERGIVNKIPKPNTPVSLSRDQEYLRTGLNIPHDGAFCGYISVGGDAMEIDGEEFPYYLQNLGIDPATGEVESGSLQYSDMDSSPDLPGRGRLTLRRTCSDNSRMESGTPSRTTTPEIVWRNGSTWSSSIRRTSTGRWETTTQNWTTSARRNSAGRAWKSAA
jgi:hypothetical protein